MGALFIDYSVLIVQRMRTFEKKSLLIYYLFISREKVQIVALNVNQIYHFVCHTNGIA